MDTQEITRRLDAICEILIDKNYNRPSGYVQTESGGGFFCNLAARAGEERISESAFSDSAGGCLTHLEKWADALPDANIKAQHEAVADFGKSIDRLRIAGIDADFIDPLSASLKAMTENLLTHDPSVAAE